MRSLAELIADIVFWTARRVDIQAHEDRYRRLEQFYVERGSELIRKDDAHRAQTAQLRRQLARFDGQRYGRARVVLQRRRQAREAGRA